ncbi:UDP-N-acetylmuramate--L-alanine ligase [Aurantibacillus circumpalustris]|uniref:UDP-N-acetylmuramate--L-alanine ligase n=1 Tax=Aurantibacillus circumpalustris TaxID=3036359 RepID=UPI00295B6921|nr:UDP-N-acetylmuramate--L-alanine ligase [Aurantibacillus circumpalustris]
MNILNYKLYYFLGVGGIGMSALARFFNHYKKEVVGYDKTESDLCKLLTKEGITNHYEEDLTQLTSFLKNYKKEEVLIVYTPAVPKEHSEYQYLLENGYTILKRSQVLGEITKQFKTIAIAGTHGKTTTTTLVTHLLKSAGINCFSFMGGISSNYNTNLLLGDVNDTNAYVVVEADEYDRSFLTLHPEIAVITSADADHLDIYGDLNHVKESYTLFSKQVKKNGVLIVKKNVDNDLNLTDERIIYSLNLDTEYCAQSITVENAQFFYDIKSPIESISNVTLGLPGLHNVENSIAAVAIAQQLGIKGSVIKEALRSFTGVKRRFDYRVKTEKVVYIDDYAHHPEELKATIGSVKKLYPGKKITGIFQPHLFSRTRDFADAFAESLDMLDECILLEIYPAREKPIEGVNSSWLLRKMKLKDKKLLSKIEVLEEIKTNKREIIVTMGAGDIDSLIAPIENILRQ